MKRTRKPALELSGVLTDREKLWQAVRRLRTFTTPELALAARVDRRQTVIKDYLASLVRAGILRRETQASPGLFNRYELVLDSGVDAPRLRKDGTPLPDTGQVRMWRAMKILKIFSVRDLVVHASLPDAPIKESTAETYCRWLTQGRYLNLPPVEDGVVRYRLIRDTGAKAPQILRIKQLYDPNTGEVVAGDPIGPALEEAEGREL